MTTVQTNDEAGQAEIRCLVMSTPDDFVHDRLARALISAGARLERYGPGLKMPCRGVDWKSIIRTAGESLSVTERHDIRITTVRHGKSAAAFANAIFGARRLDECLDQLSAEWMKEILKRDAVAVHFQPIIQQPPGHSYGYECFIRGVDDTTGFIAPERMFDAARKLDLLAKFDETCRLAAIKRAAELGIGGQLFLNFYPSAIYNPQTCLRKTIAAIEAAGMKNDQLIFMAPAGDADRAHLANILRYCQSLGFKVALKHIRPEHAALLAPADPRPDYIKFDGAFVRRAAKSVAASSGQTASVETGQAVAAGTTRLSDARLMRDMAEAARQQGIMTIVGGIETEQELQFTFDAGIRLSQGFYHARPTGEAIAPDASKDILRRAKDAYAKGKTGAEGNKPWDISGLYQKLATLAHTPAKKSA